MRHPHGIDLAAPIKPARYEAHRPSSSALFGLREWEVLGARCGKCGRTAWLDKNKVVRTFGSQYLENMGSKLVCQCGNREGNTVLVGTLGRD